MKKQYLTYEVNQDYLKLISKGQWTLQSVKEIEKKLAQIPCEKRIIWDLSLVEEFDSAGVLLFMEYLKRFENEVSVEVVGYSEKQKEMHTLL